MVRESDQIGKHQDNRDSKRVNMSLAVSVTGIINPDGTVSDRDIPATRTSDVSHSGMRLVLCKFVREKARLRIDVDHEPSQSRFSISGEVVWVRGDDTSTGYLAGIKLMDVGGSDITAWTAMVDWILNHQ